MTIAEYVKALREYDGPRMKGCLVDGDRCCALGLIAKKLEPTATRTGQLNRTSLNAIQNIREELLELRIDVIYMNDVADRSFKEIADMIETRLRVRALV